MATEKWRGVVDWNAWEFDFKVSEQLGVDRWVEVSVDPRTVTSGCWLMAGILGHHLVLEEMVAGEFRSISWHWKVR